MQTPRRSVTPEKAVAILKKHGKVVTIEEAEKILDLMYKLAPISLKQVLGSEK